MFLTTHTQYPENKGHTYTVEPFESEKLAQETFDHCIECDSWIIPKEWRNENVEVITIKPNQKMTVWIKPDGKIYCIITYTLTETNPIVGL